MSKFLIEILTSAHVAICYDQEQILPPGFSSKNKEMEIVEFVLGSIALG